MKLKDLKRKLDALPEEANDYDVLMDGGDVNFFYLEKVYLGSNWNIILSGDEDDDDIEDEPQVDHTN